MSDTAMSEDAVKTALRLMPYGFYAITTRTGDTENAMVANWVMQSSFEPRMLTIALAKSAYTHALVQTGGVFAVNIFYRADEEIIKRLTKGHAKDPDKLQKISYTPAPVTGCPVIDGAAAVLECRVTQLAEVGGDHDLLVGAVVGGAVFKAGSVGDTLTLTALGWSYAG